MKINISIPEQTCTLIEDGTVLSEVAISTALNGVGQQKDSGCTPLGRHQIRACIGANQPENTVFVARRPTGEIYTPELDLEFPERDWILTRILWLSGLELGKNRLENVDTMQRYIYIHGCPDSLPMGKPLSHGCIRMHNKDLLTLFDLVKPGTKVLIHE
ncbi:MAG: L,D-transpeptidase [Gammaproteobacteria bacterium]|nr:MAG: L,D-transpeptidase [Gammaproteobacteria bacterium]RKZ95305.1 MAG: L,D-transpeptidase [Gammaproteobacteria bacterium]RKZ98768.1 MAG: L,D-transpeptidase [Gammaproteobacteria bacterium]